MTADLVAWLRAQFDADEQVAERALWMGKERWRVLPGIEEPFHRPWQVVDDQDEGVVQVRARAADDEGVARHVARWDPARVLAEINAKRRIVDRYLAGDSDMGGTHGPDWNEPESRQLGEDVLRLLSLPYSDRPGYRDEWRPA